MPERNWKEDWEVCSQSTSGIGTWHWSDARQALLYWLKETKKLRAEVEKLEAIVKEKEGEMGRLGRLLSRLQDKEGC